MAGAGLVNGGKVLVDCLATQGVERVFCVPGESYLPVLDALYDRPEIAVVAARHEGAAANMAEADGKLTGQPGICMVTRGPGATHASIGVHTAFQDSTPMILFIGQVGTDARDREGFQEVDYRAMFGPLAKWAAEIDDPARIPEYVSRAFHVATSGRAGPVVLALPEDVLSAMVEQPAQFLPATPARAAPASADMARLQEMLAAAKRPLIVLGGSGWDDAGRAAIVRFAEGNAMPLVCGFRRQDLIDNRHANYCGYIGLGVDPRLAQRLRDADLILAIGSRLGENNTNGYSLLQSPLPDQDLVHVHPDPEELGRVYRPSLAFPCSNAEFATALVEVAIPASPAREEWLQSMRADYVDFSTPGAVSPGYVDMAHVVSWLSENLDDGAMLSNGAGNYAVWLHRYFRYKRPRTQLAPTSGAMGYGLPAAIAGALRVPGQQAVAFAGDGCFLMYPQEVGTALQYGADNLVVLVVNNGIYGTIRAHQERRFPQRPIATTIHNPDFVAMAKSFGLHAEKVVATDDFPAAFQRASAAGRPALIELIVDPLQLSPNLRISG